MKFQNCNIYEVVAIEDSLDLNSEGNSNVVNADLNSTSEINKLNAKLKFLAQLRCSLECLEEN